GGGRSRSAAPPPSGPPRRSPAATTARTSGSGSGTAWHGAQDGRARSPVGSSPPSCSRPEDPTGCGVITTRMSDTNSDANQEREGAQEPDVVGGGRGGQVPGGVWRGGRHRHQPIEGRGAAGAAGAGP